MTFKALFATLCVVTLSSGVVSAQECDTYDYIFDSLNQPENPFGTCSGNGNCTSELDDGEVKFACECDEYWTGLSDFVNTEGVDCQVFEPAILGLWSLNILLALNFARRSIPRINTRWKAYKVTRDTQLARGKKYGIKNNRALIANFIFILVNVPGIILFAIIRMAKPDERIGVTVLITIVFCIVKVSFYASSWFFQPALFGTVLKGSGKSGLKAIGIKPLIKLNDRLSLAQAVISAGGGFLPFFSIGASSEDAQVIWFIYCMLTALGLVWLFLQSYYVKVKAIEVLDQSYSISKNEKTKKMRKRIVDMQNSALVNAPIQFMIYIVWGFYAFLWNKHDYLLPISWVSMLLMGKKMAFTAVRDSRTTSKGGSENPSSKGSQSGTGSKNQLQMYSSFQGTSFNSPNPKYLDIKPPSVLPVDPPSDDEDGFV